MQPDMMQNTNKDLEKLRCWISYRCRSEFGLPYIKQMDLATKPLYVESSRMAHLLEDSKWNFLGKKENF